ncbi:cytochrome P450 [Gottfriedia acidiceleris]|uniref:cytochrome P450 n=1 Tax=Bacillaceae TaxID=186817 RepID=UPI000BEC993D|nr:MULTISPECIES: cytochrome P450 [unclassified Bacillus (in: firmicutes)]PEC47989.1 cytochrome P450 [Bacillus sp. AFS096315]PFM83317.1 cytochrome P450 [Bacillus sp. AFS077874]
MSINVKQSVEQFSLNSKEYFENRYELYERLRNDAPVFWHEEMQSWFIARYEDVSKNLLGDKFISSNVIPNKMSNLAEGEDQHFKDIIDIIKTWMVYNDRPVHSQLKGYMNRAFLVNEIELIAPEIQKIVSTIVDKVLEKNISSFDFVKEIAHPIPAMVLCKMLGIPGEEVDRFIKWSDDIALFMQDFVVSHVPSKKISEQVRGSVREIWTYLSDAIAERRKEKKNDLLSRLISETPGEDGELTDDQLIAQTMHLIFGGHKIPQFVLSNTLHLLFKNQDVLKMLKNDMSLLPKVLDETMRLEGPIQYIVRHASNDIELHGQQIKKNDSVYFFLASAGRDERVFANPDKMDISRTGFRHVAFGGGYHTCIAAAFARVEIMEILKEVITRFPTIDSLYDLENPEWTANPTFTGMIQMQVKI